MKAKNIVSRDPMVLVVLAGRLTIEIYPTMLADLSGVLIEYEKSRGE